MNSAKVVTATFSQSSTCTLTINPAGDGTDCVSRPPPGGVYQADTVVTLMVPSTLALTYR
ncbi:MAG: hypothetical protein R3264_19180 [Anaerolineae bacterium]|nr:hypothetical protein [Anaerolineae bacterium]